MNERVSRMAPQEGGSRVPDALSTNERYIKTQAERAYTPFYAIARVREYGTPLFEVFDDWVGLQRERAKAAAAKATGDPEKVAQAREALKEVSKTIQDKSEEKPYPYGTEIQEMEYALNVQVYPWELGATLVEQTRIKGEPIRPDDEVEAITLDRMAGRVKQIRDSIIERSK